MSDNPFLGVISSIRTDNMAQTSASYRKGTVKAINPLTVDVSGIDQDADSLLKNSLMTSFEVGDHLLLLPIEDEQRYIILCKVVDA